MIFFPAIDIKEGKCIRLKKGLLKNIKIYNDDPVDQAKKFEKIGCNWIHLVDIDGAFSGSPTNHEIIFEIKKQTRCKIQVGGGIRDFETIQKFLSNAVDRVILGTIAAKDPNFVKRACKSFPNRIVVGIDTKNEKVAIEGWSKTSEKTIYDSAKMYEDIGVTRVIFTDINKDGLLQGLNFYQIKKLLKSTKMNIIASGGVSSLNDLKKLKDLNLTNLEGVISGKAIYEKKFLVKEALQILC
tara:strand:+ start:135 stop:857 length:723 start_codon:yes stop_codon:yes gene_type:complete